MKTRQGFVSNSSSSSFIVAGVQISHDTWEALSEEVYNELCNSFDILNGSEDGISDGTVVIGNVKAVAECGFETDLLKIKDLESDINDVKSQLYADVNIVDEGIFIGTRCS